MQGLEEGMYFAGGDAKGLQDALNRAGNDTCRINNNEMYILYRHGFV